MRFPGTITVPDAAFEKMLESAARSFRLHGFRDIVFLGDHGGYQKDLQGRRRPAEPRMGGDAGARACDRRVLPRHRDRPTPRRCKRRGYRDDEIGTHAGLADTSLALAVDPRLVRTDQLMAAASRRRAPTACTAIRAARAPSSGSRASTDRRARPSPRSARPPRAADAARRALSTPSFTQSIRIRTIRDARRRISPCRCSVALALVALARSPGRRGAPRRRAAAAPPPSPPCPGMPPVPDPTNLYSETTRRQAEPGVAADLPRVYVPQPAVERRLRDRSGDVQGRRQVQGRPQSAARRAVVGPAHAVGREQRREHARTAA